MYDIISVGEIVIDFFQCGRGPNGNPAYEMNPDGAPANMLIQCAAMGAESAFVGLVGDDLFGNYGANSLAKYNISDEGIIRNKQDHTMVSFVSVSDDGRDRSFYFVGEGVHQFLRKEDLNMHMFEGVKLIHCSFIITKHPDGKDTVGFLHQYAQQNNLLVSADPNYRPPSLGEEDYEAVRREFTAFVSGANVIKASEIDMKLLTGFEEHEYEKGARAIAKMGVSKRAVFITMGAHGSYYYVNEDVCGFVPAFKVDAVDTTGCGDSFLGTACYYLACQPDTPMQEIVRVANAAGALTATKAGAFDAIPSREDIFAFLQAQG